VVNADSPHEILRAMGIPYVVNQWWASVCAAKQHGPRYLGLLRELGYPDDIEAYSAMALGSALDLDPVDPPWGGLPPVDLLLAETTTDATAKVFETWASERHAELVLLEATVAPLVPRRWFDSIADDWEQVLGTARIDLMVDEIHQLVRRAEACTGRRFDEAALAEVMTLANEQAMWNRRTRDLIARTTPAPIGVADAIPATMIPQWHRGSEWGRDAARRLHDEVHGRVEAGHGVVPDEQVRLMWIGRGLWFDMGFYQHFQERHGAVFVWSMYLAVAADAYLRHGDDPVRTLAGRFCGFADLYNTPPWSSEWYAKEAVHNQVDGVVHLTTDAVRGTHFITRAIEAAGVPVLEIAGSNVDSRTWDADSVVVSVEQFIADRALPHAEVRRRPPKV
jgi:benzoyl-CoA reductase/2-hydroxyglutaryl-CoA dehydratase subunit BcrC/BadD/HgdB